MKKIIVDERQLRDLLGYVHNILEFIDVEDFKDKDNKDIVVKGYDDFVKPIYEIIWDNKQNVDEYVIAKQVDIAIFKEQLENIYDIDTTNITAEKIVEVFESVEEELANDEQYAEIYNDAVYRVLKQFNI